MAMVMMPADEFAGRLRKTIEEFCELHRITNYNLQIAPERGVLRIKASIMLPTVAAVPDKVKGSEEAKCPDCGAQLKIVYDRRADQHHLEFSKHAT